MNTRCAAVSNEYHIYHMFSVQIQLHIGLPHTHMEKHEYMEYIKYIGVKRPHYILL